MKLTANEQSAILEWLSEGRAASMYCEQHNLPMSRYNKTRLESPIFSDKCDAARAIGASNEVDQALCIADDPDSDPKRARNQIEIRKWRASKFLPKTFGDKIDINVNQTIDLSSALIEARKRHALQPVRNLANTTYTQVIENVEDSNSLSVDIKSVPASPSLDKSVFD